MPSTRAKKRLPIVIWGSSGHSDVVADIVRMEDRFEIVGFVDDFRPQTDGSSGARTQILGGREVLPTLIASGLRNAVIAVGSPQARLALCDVACSLGLCLPHAIHPRAVVAENVEVGAGTVIAAGAVINPSVRLGTGVIINTAASVDHGSRVGDYVTICPGARIAGDVTIGPSTWIGIGAVVIEKVKIGERSIIGAGAVVLKNIPPGSVAYGVPARVVRKV